MADRGPRVGGWFVRERCGRRFEGLAADGSRRCPGCGAGFVRKLRVGDLGPAADEPHVVRAPGR